VMDRVAPVIVTRRPAISPPAVAIRNLFLATALGLQHRRDVDIDLPDADGPVVLVADDEPAIRTLFGRALARDGIRSLLAANGREAIDLLASNNVDIVLLDLNMPVLGGLAALREIRADPRLRALPVILVTGSDVEAAQLRNRDDRADDYLSKPVTLDALTSCVRVLLDRGPV